MPPCTPEAAGSRKPPSPARRRGCPRSGRRGLGGEGARAYNAPHAHPPRSGPHHLGRLRAPDWGDVPPFPTVLDEMARLGFQGTELGPAGYLPQDPDALRRELAARAASPSPAPSAPSPCTTPPSRPARWRAPPTWRTSSPQLDCHDPRRRRRRERRPARRRRAGDPRGRPPSGCLAPDRGRPGHARHPLRPPGGARRLPPPRRHLRGDGRGAGVPAPAHPAGRRSASAWTPATWSTAGPTRSPSAGVTPAGCGTSTPRTSAWTCSTPCARTGRTTPPRSGRASSPPWVRAGWTSRGLALRALGGAALRWLDRPGAGRPPGPPLASRSPLESARTSLAYLPATSC